MEGKEEGKKERQKEKEKIGFQYEHNSIIHINTVLKHFFKSE